MTTQYYSGPNYFGRFLGFVLALFLGALGLAVFVRSATAGGLGRVAKLVSGRAAPFSTSVPAVVEEIQRLGRLETVVYSVDTAVEGNRPPGLVADPLADDRPLLVVHGESIAGVDMGQLKREDVRIDDSGHGIHVTLPASQLFATTLDGQHTRMVVRGTGLLAPNDQNLDGDIRAKAQGQLEQTALKDGILDTARKNARATVTTLLLSEGFDRVDVM